MDEKLADVYCHQQQKKFEGIQLEGASLVALLLENFGLFYGSKEGQQAIVGDILKII